MPIKRKNVVDYDDIFTYALEKFGIGHGACCKMFHSNELLRYGHTNEFDLYFLTELIDPECELDDEATYDSIKVINAITDDDIKSEKDSDRKGYMIIAQFMKENNVKEILIDND